MLEITFNAFSFLNAKLKSQGIPCGNAVMKIEADTSVNALINNLKLDEDEVEAVFINHKIVSKDTILKSADRVALVPPGGIPNHVRAYIG
ncbi:MAG TPA: MoaD/ThiS family protein [Sulfurospirillum arcachonense]|nr:MoaD/ThiS family protein [Sulfurospirillum arcachonense]HIP45291.1 MoaD/ThiS family protein [Sulfurospirillum arcachonense]